MMRYFSFLFFLCGWALFPCSSLRSQNLLLDLFRPFYKKGVPLRTDSLFVRTPDGGGQWQTREIAYLYEGELLKEWRELRKTGGQQQILSIKEQAILSGDKKTVVTATRDSLLKADSRERTTLFAAKQEQPDSFILEIYRDNQWVPVQKTIFSYTNNKLLAQRLEQQPGASSGPWEHVSAWNYIYDNQKRPGLKRQDRWDGTAWLPQNIHRYTYEGKKEQPFSSVWLRADTTGRLVPVDSTLSWRDQQGLEDSTLLYRWNPYENTWQEAERRIFAQAEEKKAGQGKRFFRDAGGNWRSAEETEFLSGDGIFTDEPKEELLRVYDPLADIWKDRQRKTAEYKQLTDGKVYGSIRTEEFDEGGQTWKERFFAEAWFRPLPAADRPDSLAARSVEDRFTFSYVCGLPNPYVANQTVFFPENKELGGRFELKIFSDDGRLVFQKHWDNSGTCVVDALLTPGFYIVSVSKGGTPLCVQKLMVQ
jgi:hypothetical protein